MKQRRWEQGRTAPCPTFVQACWQGMMMSQESPTLIAIRAMRKPDMYDDPVRSARIRLSAGDLLRNVESTAVPLQSSILYFTSQVDVAIGDRFPEVAFRSLKQWMQTQAFRSYSGTTFSQQGRPCSSVFASCRSSHALFSLRQSSQYSHASLTGSSLHADSRTRKSSMTGSFLIFLKFYFGCGLCGFVSLELRFLFESEDGRKHA